MKCSRITLVERVKQKTNTLRGDELNQVRYKIMAAAKKLFISQGYKKTTIRQIVEESGVLIGSIYYFFKNKEEIFQSIIVDVFDVADDILCQEYGREMNPALEYAILCAIELRAVDMSEEICELFYEAYSMNSVLEKVVEHASGRSKRLFHSEVLLSDQEYFLRTLALMGMMRNYIATRYLSVDVSYDEKVATYIDLSLGMFNISSSEIESVKKQVFEMDHEIVGLTNSLIENTFVV